MKKNRKINLEGVAGGFMDADMLKGIGDQLEEVGKKFSEKSGEVKVDFESSYSSSSSSASSKSSSSTTSLGGDLSKLFK